ncbi:MAG: sugar ABC transporter permease, partial [Lachnospiraceae bacterium]|nr:sugar ABC transporter permease [Lachnospiraceae bacterium]
MKKSSEKGIIKYLKAPARAKASMAVMGLSQILQGQWAKGLLYMTVLACYVVFMVLSGAKDIAGFFTLGTVEGDAWAGIVGDDSVMMMLKGIIAYVITAFVIGFYISNVKDAYASEERLSRGLSLPTFPDAVRAFFDKKFYIVALAVPVVGVVVFNIMPIIFMILIAFTNYGGDIVPPKLVDWVGLENFKKLLVLKELKSTFAKIIGWNF